MFLSRLATIAGVSRRVVLVVMCAGYFLVLLDVTIVNVALPSIDAGLGAGVSGLQWVVDGYALALASLMLAGGAIGDLHGHKRVVLAGTGLGALLLAAITFAFVETGHASPRPRGGARGRRRAPALAPFAGRATARLGPRRPMVPRLE